MLVEFSVENFRSIKEQVTFSMVATKDKKLDGNLIKKALKKDSLLKTAAIYGANASGKSNVLMAVDFLKQLVLNSHSNQRGTGIKFEPFKLDKKCMSKPTTMSVSFIKDKIQYRYEVSYNGTGVIDESLVYFPNNKISKVFQRKKTSKFKFTIDKREQELISKRTLPETLYLSKASQDNYKMTGKAFDWFRNDLQVMLAPDNQLESHTVNLLKRGDVSKKDILKALLEVDVGIDDITPTKIGAYQLKTLHRGVEFDFQTEESEGTKKIFA